MKKSTTIVLGLTLTMAACFSDRKPVNSQDNYEQSSAEAGDWTTGDDAPDKQDTVINGNQYRRHYGLYYPIIAGMIAPRLYQGGNMSQISSPAYRPTTRTGTSSGGATSRGGFGAQGNSTSGKGTVS